MKPLYLIALIGLLIFKTGHAQQEDNSNIEEAASQATNPLAFITKFQVQPNYTFKDNSGTQFNLTTRIVQPTQSIGLPFIKSKNPSKVYTIYRLEAPIIGQTFENTPSLNATGLSDLIILDVIAFKQNWGLLGIGPGLIIPAATEPALGSGKWSAGITAVYLNTKTKGLQFGALFQQFNSFAGQSDRPDKNFMLFQPIFNKILAKGLFLQFSPIMNFNWGNNQYNIPLSLAIGKAFAKNLTMNFGPEYVVSGPNKGDFTLRLNINTMFAPVN
jgi:hypothetical protein